jgi:hypothetical protein
MARARRAAGLGRCTNPEHFQGVAIVNGSITRGACRCGTGSICAPLVAGLKMRVGLAVDHENGFAFQHQA